MAIDYLLQGAAKFAAGVELTRERVEGGARAPSQNDVFETLHENSSLPVGGVPFQ
jgi:hypothetical protein